MKILKEQKAGITGYINDQPIRQYDDSIIALFDTAEEIDKNKIIKYNGVLYYYGSGNLRNDGTYITTYWKNKPVW